MDSFLAGGLAASVVAAVCMLLLGYWLGRLFLRGRPRSTHTISIIVCIALMLLPVLTISQVFLEGGGKAVGGAAVLVTALGAALVTGLLGTLAAGGLIATLVSMRAGTATN